MCGNRVLIAISIFGSATACAKTITVSRPVSAERAAQLNEEIEGREAQVRLAEPTFSRQRPSQRDVKVGPSTIEWFEEARSTPEWVPRSAPTDHVLKIAVVNSERGALHGAGFGFLLGAAAGAIVAHALFNSESTEAAPFNFGSPAGNAVGMAWYGGVSCALLGALVGLVIGSPTTIEFTDRRSDRAGGALRPAGAGSPAAP